MIHQTLLIFASFQAFKCLPFVISILAIIALVLLLIVIVFHYSPPVKETNNELTNDKKKGG